MIYIFADKLKMLRKKNKISQEALAKSLCVSQQAVAKWENSKIASIPNYDTLTKIAEIFNVTVDYLLGTNINILKSLNKPRQIDNLAIDIENTLTQLDIINPNKDLTEEQKETLFNFMKANITANADIIKKLLKKEL